MIEAPYKMIELLTLPAARRLAMDLPISAFFSYLTGYSGGLKGS
jgi:hypothetical protein